MPLEGFSGSSAESGRSPERKTSPPDSGVVRRGPESGHLIGKVKQISNNVRSMLGVEPKTTGAQGLSSRVTGIFEKARRDSGLDR